jgi:hypothetical protein
MIEFLYSILYLSQNNFLSVERTSTNPEGIAIGHLVEDRAIYSFVLSYMGQVIGTFNNYQVKCDNALSGDCKIYLNIGSATSTTPDFQNVGNISGVFLLDNNTNTLYYTYTATDSQPHTIRVDVKTTEGTICSSTSIGISGTTLCEITSLHQQTVLTAEIYSDGKYVGSKVTSLGNAPDWQGINIFIGLFMFVSIVFTIEPKLLDRL